MDGTLSYAGLDARANQLARFLVRQGVRPGDRVGLLSDRAVDGYLGMLAVLKAHAAYVPLDPAFPPDRLSYIAADAGVQTVLSRSYLADRAAAMAGTAKLLYLDEVIEQIAGQSWERLGPGEAGEPADDLCYVIYTSGSTGRPKGVAVGHASICNFVRVAAEVYGIGYADRVYQGMTIAFDFSVEEIWVPWIAGATLVPKPDGDRVLGRELFAFLRDRQVTALCCVPTLLATLDEDLPGLRFLLVSGEPCPQDLVARWHRPGRRFLNVYGPTEATVTATWTVVHPGRPVTIGVPLPTYSVVVLDPDSGTALPPGSLGEIGIAGIGLASGYLGRPDLTERAFVHDFLGIPNNPPGRIYRTGDLGRVTADGEIEHHGRIDTQVKIRGLPHRADRDRIGPAAGARDRAGGGQHLPPGAGCGGAGRVLQHARRHGRRGSRPGLRGAARAASRVHGPGLPGAAAGDPDAAQRQGRPQEPSRAARPAPDGRPGRPHRPGDRYGAGAG